MKKHLLLLFLILVSGIVLVSCQTENVEVTPSIQILNAPATLNLNQEVQLKSHTVLVPQSDLKWSSSDQSVLTVSETGLVVAVGGGTADITLSYLELSATARITVFTLPTGINVTNAPVTLNLGSALPLITIVSPSTASQLVSYESSNSSVVTVSGNGVLNALKIGEATITATVANTSIKQIFIVSVIYVLGLKIDIANPVESIHLGETYQLETLTAPHSNPTRIWESTDSSVLTVSETGLLTPVSIGTATIKVSQPYQIGSSSYFTDSVEIEVVYPEVTGVSVEGAPEDGTAIVGSTYDLVSSVEPLLSLQEVTYTSSDTLVATVTASGKVTITGEGVVTITVASVQNPEVVSVVTIVTATIITDTKAYLTTLADNYTLTLTKEDTLYSTSSVTLQSVQTKTQLYYGSLALDTYYLLVPHWDATLSSFLTFASSVSGSTFRSRYSFAGLEYTLTSNSTTSVELTTSSTIFNYLTELTVTKIVITKTGDGYVFTLTALEEEYKGVISQVNETTPVESSVSFYESGYSGSNMTIWGNNSDLVRYQELVGNPTALIETLPVIDGYFPINFGYLGYSNFDFATLSLKTSYTYFSIGHSLDSYGLKLEASGYTKVDSEHYTLAIPESADSYLITLYYASWNQMLEISPSRVSPIPAVWPASDISAAISTHFPGLVLNDYSFGEGTKYRIDNWGSVSNPNLDIFYYLTGEVDGSTLLDTVRDQLISDGFVVTLTLNGSELQDPTHTYKVRLNTSGTPNTYYLNFTKGAAALGTVWPSAQLESDISEEASLIPSIPGGAYNYEISTYLFNKSVIIIVLESEEAKNAALSTYLTGLLSSGWNKEFLDPSDNMFTAPTSYWKGNIQLTIQDYSTSQIRITVYPKQEGATTYISWPEVQIGNYVPEDYALLIPTLPGDRFYIISQDKVYYDVPTDSLVIYAETLDYTSYSLLLEDNGFVLNASSYYTHPSNDQFTIRHKVLTDGTHLLSIVKEYALKATSWSQVASYINLFYNALWGVATVVYGTNLPEVSITGDQFVKITTQSRDVRLVFDGVLEDTIKAWFANLVLLGFNDANFNGSYRKTTNAADFIYSSNPGFWWPSITAIIEEGHVIGINVSVF